VSPEILRGVPLAEYTTFRIGGPARFLAIPSTVGELAGLVRWAHQEGVPLLLLGGGSNILVGDGGFPGLVVVTRGLVDVEIEGDRIRSRGGVFLGLLSAMALRAGLSGLEPLGGIPGTLGGALLMNAGAYGRFLGEMVEEVEVLVDGEVEALKGGEVEWGYRWSSLRGYTVVGATLRLVPGEIETIREEMARYSRLRRQKQPLDFPSAGSVFKNPPGESAGRLIEEAGFKGARVGDAMVSPVHANFIINLGRARARDVRTLVALVKEGVREEFSILLEEEIVYAGVFEAGEDEDRPPAGRTIVGEGGIPQNG